MLHFLKRLCVSNLVFLIKKFNQFIKGEEHVDLVTKMSKIKLSCSDDLQYAPQHNTIMHNKKI